MATDGGSGALLAWIDSRDAASNVYCARVLASGLPDPRWPADGRPLAGQGAAPAFPVLIPDGTGGAIVGWQDDRSAATGTDLYAQRVLASGTLDPAWSPNGAPLCTAAGSQHALATVPDGAGGAIAVWMDERSGPGRADLYAQHLLATGALDPRWPRDGVAVCTAPGPQEFPAIVPDGAGGAIVAWYDLRFVPSGFDVYAQHVLASGVLDPAWPVGGRAVCRAEGDQVDVVLATDGAGGAIVAWDDNRRGLFHPFAQHVLASGAVDPAWPMGGRAVSNCGVAEEFPQIVPDGAGGAILAWQTREFHVNVFAHHLRADGRMDPTWPTGGRALAVRAVDQTSAVIVADGAGGAVVAWQEGSALAAQHVLPTGALDPEYGAAGRVLCDGAFEKGPPALASIGPRGVMAAWPQQVNGPRTDLQAVSIETLP